MVRSGRLGFFGGGVCLWALLVSLLVHGAVFTAFAFLNVSEETGNTGKPRPAEVSVTQIKKVVANSPIIPKPSVKRVDLSGSAGKKPMLFETETKQAITNSAEMVGDISEQLESELLAGQFDTSPATNFFGSTTTLRKICYVVDASGSMQGRLGMLVRSLKESIASLEPDQYFYIIFFRGDGLVESGSGKLVRAGSSSKSKAFKFIDTIRFEGPTNAHNAIERAMHITGPGGNGVEQIYFLSDGFDFNGGDDGDFAGMIENMQKRLAPSVRINTIGVWVGGPDEKILRTIAASSGGEYVGLD